jgi:hypothetical protein
MRSSIGAEYSDVFNCSRRGGPGKVTTATQWTGVTL